MKKFLLFSILVISAGCAQKRLATYPTPSDLHFKSLATVWDEAMPLGNADIGSLIWQKENSLRFSLDRVDLWDLRPTDSLQKSPTYSFDWIIEQVNKGDLGPVRRKYEDPYSYLPGPSKIPGAALEFNTEAWGKVTDTRLYLRNALCSVDWENGVSLKTYIHADESVGWFIFENMPETFDLELIPPSYETEGSDKGMGLHDLSLSKLGYKQGEVIKGENLISYHQQGYGDFFYDVAVTWKRKGANVIGAWSVTSSLSGEDAVEEVKEAMERGIANDYADHMAYWDKFWTSSEIAVPDTVIQHQYDKEIYKFGSATRKDSYPISLQAVWTADNGNLPPWKGDYHHDLNTQLSYWPAYSGNRLDEGLGYLNTIWNQREVYKEFTRDLYGKEGLNIPGVCTLDGYAMGGWTQNSFSQTTAAWVGQHFYLHWKYSADNEFLAETGYPFMYDVALFLEQQSYVNKDGIRTLELSTSPEIYDNSLRAWFRDLTNYDLALMRFTFLAAAEMAEALGKNQEAAHWKELETQLPDYALDSNGALCFAPGFPYNESHRHFSNAMAIHPLGLIDISNGPEEKKIVEATLDALYNNGPAWWTGYSYSWLGNIEARAGRGEKAAEALKIFAECFCLRNSFHANGDQSRSGKSNFDYRPFTLEGNFAFASGVHEMLLQSHTGTINVFPAIPTDWKDVSFKNMRAVGAFIVSAEMKNGEVVSLEVRSEKGGKMKIRSPRNGEIIEKEMKAGETARII